MKIFLLILFYFKLAYSIFYPGDEMGLIVDVARSYNRPTIIVATVCWTKQQKMEFVLRLKLADSTKSITFTKKAQDFDGSKNSLYVVDLRCPNAKGILNEAQKENKLRGPNRWLIVGKSINETYPIPLELKDLVVLPDSDFIVANNYDGGYYELNLIYKIHSDYEWITESFGNWTAVNGFRISDEILVSKQMRRKNLRRHNIRITLVLTVNRTRTDLCDISRLDEDPVTKNCYRKSLPMFEFLNATPVNVFTDTWGYFVNGTWNGMLGDIIYDRADFGGTVLFLIADRLDKLDYLTPADANIKFVFREPSLSSQHNLYLLPFKTSVWICIGVFVLVMAVVLFISAKWEEKKTHNEMITKPSDVVMMVVSAMSLQGTSGQLKGSIGRMVMFILFLAFLFLHTSYSASVVALLQSTSNQIRTLKDLVNSKLEIGVEDTPYNLHYFPNAKDPIRKALYNVKVAPKGSKPRFMSSEEGVRKMQKSAFAFHMNTNFGYWIVQKYFYEHEKCGLREISYYPPMAPWFFCKKNSPYKELFLIALIRTLEHGMKKREERLMLAQKPLCYVRGGSVVSVSIVEIYPALLMLLYGVVLAVAILFVEILVNRSILRQRCQ